MFITRTAAGLVLSVAALAFAGSAADSSNKNQKMNVAVLDLDTRGGLTKEEIKTIADRLRGELMATGRYSILERGQMDVILKEQGFQQTGACSDASCLVEAGQLLAVHKMIGGSIGKVGKVYSINLKTINVETGKIESQFSDDIKCSKEQLVSFHIRNVARQMAGLAKKRRPLSGRWYVWGPAGAVTVGASVCAVIVFGGKDKPGNGSDNLSQVTIDGTLK